MLIGHSLSDGNGIILAIDESVADLLYRRTREIVGRSYLDITYPEDRARNRLIVDRLPCDAGPHAIRKRYLRADGSAVWLEVDASRVSHGPGEGHLIGTLRLVEPLADSTPWTLWQTAREMLEHERLRRTRLGHDMVGDLAWMLLLHVYLAEAEGRALDLDAIERLDGIRTALACRWMKAFETSGLVETSGDAADCHQLTQAGSTAIEHLLRELTAR